MKKTHNKLPSERRLVWPRGARSCGLGTSDTVARLEHARDMSACIEIVADVIRAGYRAVDVKSVAPVQWLERRTHEVHHGVSLSLPYTATTMFSALVLLCSASVATFVAQVNYYSNIVTTESVVQGIYELHGYECRPLQKDAIYGLEFTYDECMATYQPPSHDNVFYSHLVHDGYSPCTSGGFGLSSNEAARETHFDGPWNFSTVRQLAYRGDWDTTNDWLSFAKGPERLYPWERLKTCPHTATLYHKPFRGMPHVYALDQDRCRIAMYPGMKNHDQYDDTDPLFHPIDWAIISAQEGQLSHGFAHASLCNKLTDTIEEFQTPGHPGFPFSTLKYGFMQSEDEQYSFHRHVFMMNQTDFHSGDVCPDGAFTQEMEEELKKHGTFAVPHVSITEKKLRVSNIKADQPNCRYMWNPEQFGEDNPPEGVFDCIGDLHDTQTMLVRPYGVGITPLYPYGMTLKLASGILTADDASQEEQWLKDMETKRKRVLDEREFPWNTVLYPRDHYKYDGHFFGHPRCQAYERALAREAFEFMYSHSDCHPCDTFKYNSPFLCTREVRRGVLECVGLSIANSAALLGVLIALTPSILKCLGLKLGHARDKTNLKNGDVPEDDAGHRAEDGTSKRLFK